MPDTVPNTGASQFADTSPTYDFRAAEPRWQAAWDAAKCFRVDDVPQDAKPKYYVLDMFPYPSGKIHMGHVRNYALGDVVARFKRARGFSVLNPMGWDAFGLPAENAALERGLHPNTWTRDNIDAMRAQMQRLGLALDWSREFATCDPSYYGHQQKLFLDLLRAGLVDRRESWVNWDPVDGTVLANEQVIDGHGWRSGAAVEKRQLAQWFFRITHYATELLEALDGLDRWPERVRTMQARWIGRSEGARIRFPLTGPAGEIPRSIEVFSTRPDTLFGMSFLAVAPEHPVAELAAAANPQAAAFVAECRALGTSEAAIERAEKRGLRHRAARRAPVPAGPDIPGVDREFRADGIRHRGDLRLPRPRPARHRVRPQIRAARHPCSAPAGREPGHLRARRRRLYRAGPDHQLGLPRRARYRGGPNQPPSKRSRPRAPARASSIGACATGV